MHGNDKHQIHYAYFRDKGKWDWKENTKGFNGFYFPLKNHSEANMAIGQTW